jgi:ferritin-like metal-binding protein YciE
MKKKKLRTGSRAPVKKKIVRAVKKVAKVFGLKGEADNLRALFLHELKDIYWAEKHLVKALTKMEKAATSPELQMAFADHRAVTEKQAERLERIFVMAGEKVKGEKCQAIQGLTEEGNEITAETDKNTMTRDAGLIIAAQKVEHYEIAAYGSLLQLARTLGMKDAAQLLEETLREEKETDTRLTEIAERSINVEAAQEEGV